VRRQAYWVVAGQALVAIVGGLVCYFWRSALAGQAALTGGGIGALATLAQVLVGLRNSAGQDPKLVVSGFYRGSAAKFVLTVALFVWALRGRRVDAAPMFITYAVTFLVYWVALAKSLTPAAKM
jgi:ATP synthase protein I